MHPLDADERTQTGHDLAGSAVTRERKRRPLAGEPDDLALAACRDFEAGRSVVVQGSLDSGYRIRGHCNERGAKERSSCAPSGSSLPPVATICSMNASKSSSHAGPTGDWRIDRDRAVALFGAHAHDWPIEIVEETGSTNADLM